MRPRYTPASFALAIIFLVAASAIALTGCSAADDGTAVVEDHHATLLNADQFLYLRCNATGWDVTEANRLQSTSDPNVVTLTYQVTQPWMVSGPDHCYFTLTNQRNGYGTSQTYYSDPSPSIVLSPPLSQSLVVSSATFGIRYPALGAYSVTVNWQLGTFVIAQTGLLAGRVTMDGTRGGTPVSGAGVAGATVLVQGVASRSAITDTNGAYAFTNLAVGSYTVTVQKAGATFTPPGATGVRVISGNAGSAQFFTCAYPCGTGPAVDPGRELFIQDPSVLTDARASDALDGPWSFRFLLEQMTPPGMTTNALVEAFLQNFHQSQRDETALRRVWPTVIVNGQTLPDATRPPFRLLAIVNRVDAHATGNGEARFVYGVNAVPGAEVAFDPSTQGFFTAIFEFFLPPTAALPNRQAWASRFHALGQAAFGPSYNAQLQAITDAFARRNALPATAGNPTGSALNDFRISEQLFTVAPWEFREFHLLPDPVTAKVDLVDTTVQQSPDSLLSGQNGPLPDFLNANASLVKAGLATLPAELVSHISAGVSLVIPWSFPSVTDEALRHAFAGQNCIGCHSTEANNPNDTFAPGSLNIFYQVSPLVGQVAGNQSGFIKKVEIPRRISFMQNQLTCSGATCAVGAEALMGPE